MSKKNAVAPFLQPEKLKNECGLTSLYIVNFFKTGIVASLYIFDSSVSSVLQYLLDLNILFISEKLSLTLWNLKIEMSKGLNKIEINEKEALFILE